MTLYNRTLMPAHQRANAEDVNRELAKIALAISQLEETLNSLEIGAGSARFMWVAFADSDDGTNNFSHSPGTRRFIGVAFNKLTDVASDEPADYTWLRFQGADARSINLSLTGEVFQFDQNGNSLGLAAITITAIGTNLLTPITFTAFNDSGNAVALVAGADADEKILPVENFGAAQFVNIGASAHDGEVIDTAQVVRQVTTLTFNPRGAYDDTATYQLYDVVTFAGGTYYALGPTTGNEPSGTDQDNAHWKVMTAPSTGGAAPGAPFNVTIDLTTSAAGVNLRTLADANGYDGASDATILFRVPNGVTVTGVHSAGRGIDTGTWPTGATLNLDLEVQNGGIVRGGGGDGGHGGNLAGSGAAGTNGGDAVHCQTDIDVTIDVGGTVSGGGGGGGGGNGRNVGTPGEPAYAGGGGGGGGFPNGVGGTHGNGDQPGVDGANGTPAGFGAGGAGGFGGGYNGRGGGNAAGDGAPQVNSGVPGTAGYAVRKNGHTVNVTNNGTMQGTAA